MAVRPAFPTVWCSVLVMDFRVSAFCHRQKIGKCIVRPVTVDVMHFDLRAEFFLAINFDEKWVIRLPFQHRRFDNKAMNEMELSRSEMLSLYADIS